MTRHFEINEGKKHKIIMNIVKILKNSFQSFLKQFYQNPRAYCHGSQGGGPRLVI